MESLPFTCAAEVVHSGSFTKESHEINVTTTDEPSSSIRLQGVLILDSLEGRRWMIPKAILLSLFPYLCTFSAF